MQWRINLLPLATVATSLNINRDWKPQCGYLWGRMDSSPTWRTNPYQQHRCAQQPWPSPPHSGLSCTILPPHLHLEPQGAVTLLTQLPPPPLLPLRVPTLPTWALKHPWTCRRRDPDMDSGLVRPSTKLAHLLIQGDPNASPTYPSSPLNSIISSLLIYIFIETMTWSERGVCNR